MQSNWQETFFRGVALEAWRRAVNPEMTRTEADFLERTFGVDAGAQLLDVSCGNGRHAIELAGRGYQMTGLDLSDEFIAEARSAIELPVRWVRGDMRSLSWVSEFDGAYCFGNSFGYLTEEEARQSLAGIARVEAWRAVRRRHRNGGGVDSAVAPADPMVPAR